MKLLRQSELLLQTNYGVEWIKQIDAVDRDSAEGLLDKLLLVSSSEYSAGIYRLLETEFDTFRNQSLTLYAAREIDRNVEYFDAKRIPTPLSTGNDHLKVAKL